METLSDTSRTFRQALSHRTSRFSGCGIFLLIWLGIIGSALAADLVSLDTLMGGQGRTDHQKRIDQLVFENGRTYNWEDFSAWGKEIFLDGSVKNPPAGSSPSEPVSQFFKCATCHNYKREDPDLSVQDPEARFEWIEKTGKNISLLQGATLWGVVNRETFYADYFAIYHDLCVPKGRDLPWLPCGPLLGFCGLGCRTMDPGSLNDAVQVCSAYCSVGRYLETWELYALLAFLWDQEIKLHDLGLSPEKAAKVKTVLTSDSSDPQEKQVLRSLLSSKYAKKANMSFRGIPRVKKKPSGETLVVEYSDGAEFTGDPGRGQRLWLLSCGRCHGTEGMPQKARHFTEDLEEFHEMLAEGTRSSYNPYMPNYTLERLSRQQAADILAYLNHFSE